MAQHHPLLLSAPILALSFATLIAQGDPPGSGLRPAARGSTRALLATVSIDDAAAVRPGEQAMPAAPVPNPAASAQEALAARVSAALMGSPSSSNSARRAPTPRKGIVGAPSQLEAAVSASGPSANVDWVCGAWVELWQGRGRGRDCSWVQREDVR